LKKLDRFILYSFLGPFIMVFLIVVFILVMQFLWLYIDELVGKGLSLWVILEFLMWGSCTILPLAMPLATLIASIMTLGNMGESNELLAMNAAGISLKRVLIPLIVVSVGISIGAFFVSNNLIPVAYNKIYTLQHDINRTKEEIKIPTGTFYNVIDGYTLRISDRNKETDMMYDVMVYDHTKNKGNISVAVADSGLIKSTADKSALVFTLYNGASYEEENTMKYRDTTLVLNKIEFDMQEIVIPLKNYAFKKSEEDKYGNEIMAKNLKSLQEDRDSIGEGYDKMITKHHNKYMYGMGLSFPTQLDSAKNKGYLDIYEIDSLFARWNAEQELSNIDESIDHSRNSQSMTESFEREIAQNSYFLRKIDLESYRKFTLSFACLVFFFIGAPLGAIIRKGGLGTPVIISAMFFVLYWVVDISGKKLATDGAITPMIGAFISTLVLLPMGIFLTWKATSESSSFNMESFKQDLVKLFKRYKSKYIWRKGKKTQE
jgi:lipopolysaccharide export system permease protein